MTVVLAKQGDYETKKEFIIKDRYATYAYQTPALITNETTLIYAKKYFSGKMGVQDKLRKIYEVCELFNIVTQDRFAIKEGDFEALNKYFILAVNHDYLQALEIRYKDEALYFKAEEKLKGIFK